MEGVFYFDTDDCLAQTLTPEYGNITPEYMFRTVAPLKNTGNAMLAIYDFVPQIAYLSYGNYTTSNPGYNRSMNILNMTQLFNL